ncbi:hypothetical protein Tco_0619288 [Tanacetum coccineum]
MHNPELRPTKDFEEKYNKVKAKLALISSSASPSKSTMVKNKGLIVEAYEWDEEEVSSDDNEMVEVKVLMALAKDNDAVSKEGARNGEWVKISMRKHVNTEILKENQNLRKELKELTAITETWLNNSNKVNHFGQKDLVFVKSSANDTKVSIPSVERPWLSEAEAFILPNHDTDEYLVYSTLLPPLEKLGAPTKINKKASASKINSAPTRKLKHVKTKDDFPLSIVMKELNDLKLQISKNQSSYSRDNNSQQCGIKKPIWYLDSGCSRHMTGVKIYLYKYMEQQGPKVVFGDDSTCVTEGYGSIRCNGIVFIKVAFVNGLKYNLISISQLCDAKYIVQFDEKRGASFNSNKEIVMIAPRVRDVYVLDMTSSE